VKAKPAPTKATPVPPTKATAAKPAPTPKPVTPPTATTPEKPTTGKGTPGPRAGGGPEGGQGADVANVHVKGLDFPFPGYLQNIVRQVALRFSPPNRTLALSADISFLIHRDGSVSDVRIVKRSGSYAFDLEAQGAIEAVNAARAFGPLPDGFHGDVLPVTFSFDPRVIR
jgi:protein TonB